MSKSFAQTLHREKPGANKHIRKTLQEKGKQCAPPSTQCRPHALRGPGRSGTARWREAGRLPLRLTPRPPPASSPRRGSRSQQADAHPHRASYKQPEGQKSPDDRPQQRRGGACTPTQSVRHSAARKLA